MMLDALVLEIKQLPVTTRLALVEIIAESVRQELSALQGQKLSMGMLKPEGAIPSDEELHDDYVTYLIEKYK
jgi:hypothetical protein